MGHAWWNQVVWGRFLFKDSREMLRKLPSVHGESAVIVELEAI